MTILITTYHGQSGDDQPSGRGAYLAELIASVDKIMDETTLHIIVDDGSIDSTCEKLKALHSNNTRRIFLRREKGENEPLTSTNARNFAISKCFEGALDSEFFSKQKYVTFVDSDDILIDIQSRTNQMDLSGAIFLFSDALIFFNDTDVSYFWNGLGSPAPILRKRIWVEGRMAYPTMVWDLEFLRTLKEFVRVRYGFDGPFDPTIGCGEDVDIALSSLECAGDTQKIDYLPEVSVAYRIHDNSLASIRSSQERAREEHAVLVRHFGRCGAAFLHLRRFVCRPECYIASLWPLRNAIRRKAQKSAFI